MKMMKLGVLAIVTFGLLGCTVDQQSGTAVQSAPSLKSSTAPKSGQTIFQVMHDNFSKTNHNGNAPWKVTPAMESYYCPMSSDDPDYWDAFGRIPATQAAVHRYYSARGWPLSGESYVRTMRIINGTSKPEDLPRIYCYIKHRKSA